MSNPFDAYRGDLFGFDLGELSSNTRTNEYRKRVEIAKLARWFTDFAAECHANLSAERR